MAGGFVINHIYTAPTPGSGTVTSITITSSGDTISIQDPTVTTLGTIDVDITGKAPTDAATPLGTSSARWSALILRTNGGISWDDGSGNGDLFSYENTEGPKFYDQNTDKFTNISLQANTSDRALSVQNLDGALAVQGDPQFFQPTAGGTVTVLNVSNIGNTFINPLGTLATLTLTLSDGVLKNQIHYVTFTQIITALTVTSSNVSNKGLASPSAATASSTFAWAWDGVSKWNRFI
jgi:hypothetical protein